MIRHRTLAAGLAAGLLLLAASTARAQDKVTLILDWFVNPDHAPLIVAFEKGYFKEAGLDVELIAPSNASDPPKLVAAGKADLAVSYQPALHIQVGEGLPLARIATLVDTPLNTVIVLQDGPVKTIADLKGRKIGFSTGGTEEALLATILAKHGVKTSEVTLINVGFNLTTALASGQVDAITGGYRNFELTELDLVGKKAKAFFVEEEGVPFYDELILVANAGRLGDKKLARFVTALERGVAFLVNHPDQSWTLFLKNHKDLDDELNRRAWRDTLPRFSHSPAALNRGRYLRFAQFLKSSGLVTKVPALETYAVELIDER